MSGFDLNPDEQDARQKQRHRSGYLLHGLSWLLLVGGVVQFTQSVAHALPLLLGAFVVRQAAYHRFRRLEDEDLHIDVNAIDE
ncbi:MAG: hypothetical protein AAGA48_02565 [Myxococcota bacterium]